MIVIKFSKIETYSKLEISFMIVVLQTTPNKINRACKYAMEEILTNKGY